MPRLFTSYSRLDQKFVQALKTPLDAAGHDVWIDVEGLRPSEQWRTRLQAVIDEASALLIVLSPNWLSSTECRRELDYAVSVRKKLIPVVYRDVNPAEVPEAVRDLNWVYWREHDDPVVARENAIQAIETDLEWADRHSALLIKARAWEQGQRRTDLLLRGQELREAEGWFAQAASHPKTPPSTLHAEFLLAARRYATRQRRAFVAAAGVGLTVLAFLVAWGWQETRLRVEEGKTAEARQQADAAEKERLAFEGVAAKATANEATARSQLAEAEAERAREAERQQATLKQEQASLREVAEAYRVLYRDPAQAAVHAWRAARDRPSGESDRAMSDAWRVAVAQRANRIAMSQLREIRELSFERRERLGDVYSVIGRGGRHILIATPRQGSAFDPNAPGIVYLLDSETLRTTELKVCGQGVGLPRLEFTGFSSAGDHVFVTRGFYVDVYDLSGRCLLGGSLQFQSTKSPVHLVGGPLASRFLIGSDVQGRVWLLDTQRKLPPKPVESLGRATYDITSKGDALVDIPVSPDGAHAIGLFEGGRAVLVRVTGKGLEMSLPLASSGVLAVAFDPRRRETLRWAMARSDGTVEFWHSPGDRPKVQVKLAHRGKPVDVLSYATDGTALVTIDSGCALRLWESNTGRLLYTRSAAGETACPAARTVPPDSAKTAPSTKSEDAESTPGLPAAPVAGLPTGGRAFATLTGARAEVTEMAASADNRWLATGGEDGIVHLWDLQTRKHVRQWAMDSFDRIRALAFDPSGGFLAAATAAGKLGLWRAADGAATAVMQGWQRSGVRALEFSGRQTLNMVTDEGLLAVQTERPEVSVVGSASELKRARRLVSFSSDRRLLVAREDGPPMLLDATSGKVLEFGSGTTPSPMLAVNAHGDALVSSDGRSVQLWKSGPLTPVNRTLQLPGARVSSVAIRPDGRVIAAGFGEGTIRLWDAQTGARLADLTGAHIVTPIDALRFTTDGQTLISGGGDHKVVLWSLSP